MCLQMHLWLTTAETTSVQAEGWLTLPVLSAPISDVLAHCVGGRALRLLVLIEDVVRWLLARTGGSDLPLLALCEVCPVVVLLLLVFTEEVVGVVV